MARYFVDCEFDGHNGALLSIALVRDDAASLYVIVERRDAAVVDPWVRDNVLTVIDQYVAIPDSTRRIVPLNGVGHHLRGFIEFVDEPPVIIADSPVDISRFCAAYMTDTDGNYAPNLCPLMKFEVHDVDCYPTDLPGAVQHNAWWDAMALREKLLATTAA